MSVSSDHFSWLVIFPEKALFISFLKDKDVVKIPGCLNLSMSTFTNSLYFQYDIPILDSMWCPFYSLKRTTL